MIRVHRRLLGAALLLAAPPFTARAQQAGVTAVPDSAVAKIDRAFAALGGPDAPGCAVGLSENGRPVLTREGVPTDVLAAAVKANDNDVDAVVRWYSIPRRAVQAAVEFETRLAA